MSYDTPTLFIQSFAHTLQTWKNFPKLLDYILIFLSSFSLYSLSYINDSFHRHILTEIGRRIDTMSHKELEELCEFLIPEWLEYFAELSPSCDPGMRSICGKGGNCVHRYRLKVWFGLWRGWCHHLYRESNEVKLALVDVFWSYDI